VAQPVDLELVAEEAGADRADDRLDLLVVEDAVDRRFLDVEDLAAQRQDRLMAEPALLGGAAGGVAFDQEQLGLVARRPLLAVRELGGQAAALERRLAPHQVARLARRLARAQRVHRLAEDRARDRRRLLEARAQALADDGLDDRLRFAVAELDLRLAL